LRRIRFAALKFVVVIKGLLDAWELNGDYLIVLGLADAVAIVEYVFWPPFIDSAPVGEVGDEEFV
jgi:hypothetical protein